MEDNSIFNDPQEGQEPGTEGVRVKKTDRHKRSVIAIIITAAVFVLLLVGYFVISSVLNSSQTTDTVELFDGEAAGPNNTILMFEHIERESIQSIHVENAYGKYTFARDKELAYNDFGIEGFKGISYNAEKFSYLVVASGYTVSFGRVTDDATEEEIAKYGLDDPVAKCTMTTTEGAEHTFYVGDKMISGDGYYAMYEGRNAIYILSNSLDDSVLRPVEYFVDPVLCYGMSENDYYLADNFLVLHDGEPFVQLAQCEKEEFVNPDAQAETKLMYPEGYKGNDSLFLNVIQKFVSMSGDECVALGYDEETAAKYGVKDPYYSIYFTYKNIEYYVFVSELQEDGYYYAISNMYGYQGIMKCQKDLFSWLDYDLLNWIDEYPVMLNITYTDSIYIDDGKNGGVTYTLTHGTDEAGTATLEVEGSDGFRLSNSEVYNFRNLYKVLLSVQIMGNSELDDEAVESLLADDSARMLTIRFTMKNGKTNEYSFYRYSTRRALFLVNGEGRFYVMADWVEKILSDMDRLYNGLEIDSYSKN